MSALAVQSMAISGCIDASDRHCDSNDPVCVRPSNATTDVASIPDASAIDARELATNTIRGLRRNARHSSLRVSINSMTRLPIRPVAPMTARCRSETAEWNVS